MFKKINKVIFLKKTQWHFKYKEFNKYHINIKIDKILILNFLKPSSQHEIYIQSTVIL